MFDTVPTVLTTLVILYGLILISRKKFMINALYTNILMMFLTTIPAIGQYRENGYWLSFLYICVLPFFVAMIMISKGRYIMTNVNSKIIVLIITNFLDKRNISYEQQKKV